MEWKELKIDNLPPDILTGDYQFQWKGIVNTWTNYSVNGIYEIIEELEKRIASGIRYRKPEPKVPTHEEIMTKWWGHGTGEWGKVVSYDREGYVILTAINTQGVCGSSDIAFAPWVVNRAWFTGRESADCPPEAN